MLIRLRTCTSADTPFLVQALNECLYQNYRFKVVMTEERFLEDNKIHDIDLGATFLALRGDAPVGITLVARRGPQAWIAGMGVHPTLRGQGLGTELLRRSQDRLRVLGVTEIELEVLVENEIARRCYTNAGFIAFRRYSCFRGTAMRIPWSWQTSRIVKTSPELILEDFKELHRAKACWQRNLPTLTHRAGELRGLIASQRRKTVASLLYSENAIADVGWISDGPPLDRLLQELLLAAFGTSRPFAIVNVPNDDELGLVMHESGFEVYAEQLDMRCTLQGDFRAKPVL